MDFYRPIRFIFGECVYVSPRRDFARLANLFAAESIPFRASPADGEGNVEFRVSLLSAERAEDIAARAGADAKPLARRGLPFKAISCLKRFGLVAGSFAAVAICVISQLFVWKIEVSGNATVSAREIIDHLENCGVSVGGFIPKIDTLRSANELLMDFEPISSAAITVRGNRVLVSVLERKNPPGIIDTSGYYNVVAARDGTVIDVDAYDGTPEISAGDTVYEGQLLINSFIAGKYGTFLPTHARGKVIALVQEHFEITVPFKQMVKVYTGNKSVKKTYVLLGKEIPAFFSENSPYEYFDTVTAEYDLELFGAVELPARVSTVTYIEYVPKETVIPKSEAEAIARGELDGWLASLDREIAECGAEVTFDEKNGACFLKADAAVITDICLEVPLTINDYGVQPNRSARLPNARE